MKPYKNTDVLKYLKLFGDFCLAHSTLQPNLEYFHSPDIGYLAYIRYKHVLFSPKEHIIVLGNPICPENQYLSILKEFINATHQQLIFLHHDERLIGALEKLNYKTNMFGTETLLDLESFSLKGKNRSKLRQWYNKSCREQVICEEVQLNTHNYHAMKKVSTEWLAKKQQTNFGILTRPFTEKDQSDVRFFVAKQNETIIAFAGFDPLYKHEKIIGYYHNFDRMLPNAPHGVGATILLHAMNTFKLEGIKFVSLGLSPLYNLKNYPTQNKFTLKVLRFTFKYLNFIYPFKGNASHKKKFDGNKKPIYFSSKENSILDLFIILFSLYEKKPNTACAKISISEPVKSGL